MEVAAAPRLTLGDTMDVLIPIFLGGVVGFVIGRGPKKILAKIAERLG